MTIEIALSHEETGKLLGATGAASVVLSSSDFNTTTSNKDKQVHVFSGDFAKSHTAGGADKSEGADALTSVDVPMENIYKLLTFNDFEAEEESALVAKIVAKSPEQFARTYDASVFGTEFWTESPFPAITTNTAVVDATADSWADAIAEVYDAGFNPDTLLAVNQARGLLKSAYADGAQTNTLRDGVISNIDGVDVNFRNLKTGPVASGDVLGVIYDSSQLVTYLKEEVETDYYSAKNDFALRQKNKDAVYVGTRFGVKLANAAAAVLIVAA